jgi:homoserine O-acetyltransferase
VAVEGKHELGDFELQSGIVLENAFLSYEFHGELNAERSNAILYPTWYAGNHETNRPAIAEGRALDPAKYCVIVPDMFCNGLSSSPSNTPEPHDRARFPLVTPYDNVVAQQHLCTELFGIERLAMVAGFSMSAQQAFHWAAMYPDMVACIAPICGTAKTSPHNWLFLEGVKQALQADAAWAGGDYEEPPQAGLRAFSTVYSGWSMSQSYFREGLYQNVAGVQFKTLQEFLDFMTGFFSQMDANDLLGMVATWQSADISNNAHFNGNLSAALNAITCPAMVMPCETDLYFPPADNELEVAQMPDAELRVIPSIYGHIAGLPGFAPAEDDAFIDQGLRDLLARVS